MTKERGVYNLCVQEAGEGNVERAVDVSPNEMEVEVDRGRASGGLQQVNPQDRERNDRVLTVRRQSRQECHQCLRSRHK